MTDSEIVIKALADQQHFGELIERYHTKLDRYIGRIGVRNPDDREDVLQEIFIKVYRNLNNFDTSLSFSSWIYRIAHNESVSWYRKQSVRPEGNLVGESDLILELLSDDNSSAETTFDQTVNASEMSRALNELEEKYRTVLILRFFEYKEYEEISDILKIPVGTVGTLVYRGKQRLKTIINPEQIHV